MKIKHTEVGNSVIVHKYAMIQLALNFAEIIA